MNYIVDITVDDRLARGKFVCQIHLEQIHDFHKFSDVTVYYIYQLAVSQVPGKIDTKQEL